MYNRNWSESPQQRIENKLKEAHQNRQKAIDSRVRQLQRELTEQKATSMQMQDLRRDFQQFKGKMKSLYTSIFQGSKELSIRKSDLIRQIKGNEIEDQQLKMNQSFRESGQSPTIVQWFQNYQYPFCKKANSLSSLRSGIAIAQILTEKLPESYQPLFLPNIEIYNITPQRAILNLKVILNTLKSYYSQHPELNVKMEDFNGQGLYFDHNMMQTFIFTVIMNLQSDSKEIPSDQALKNAYIGVEEISDIANLSSIMPQNESKPTQQQNYTTKNLSRKSEKVFVVNKNQAKMQKIYTWIKQCHHIDVQQMDPEQIIGELVNSIFTGSRLDHEKVVKKSHYQLGPSIVFKKVCEYLLSCERMPKQKVLQLRQEVDQGSIRQQLFWGVIEDMMNIKTSHSSKIRKNKSRSRQKTQQSKHVQAQKENIIKSNVIAEPKKEAIKKIPQVYVCNQQFIKKAEDWIINQLGYEFSLNKSRNNSKIQENPLLNGVLLGSIVMRMQLGKVNINKEPKRKIDVEKNMSEVLNCVIRRGLQSARKFANFKAEYKTYLGILWQIKEEVQRKSMIQKLKRTEIARQKKQQARDISQDDKRKIVDWLRQLQIEVKSLQYIHPNIISEVCGDILQLRLFRQTTKRIKQNNMIKIMQELRRLGWQHEGNYADALSQQGNEMRWSILKFSQELVKHKIYYYR